MRRSEIFNEFVKIAEDNGIVSDDKNPRYDSLSISDIEKLYGVMPEQDVKYKKNIMEVAHPESLIISPAYDKINGLVENNIERQNIILNIVNKNNNGFLTQHRYAEKELLLSLVKIANDLDNKDKDDLRSLADTCIGQIHNKNFKKQAFSWLPVLGVIAAGLYIKSHIDDFNGPFKDVHENLISKLDKIIDSESFLGFGYDIDPAFKSEMEDFKSKLENFYSLYERVLPYLQSANSPKTDNERIEKAKLVSTGKNNEYQNLIRSYQLLSTMSKNMNSYFDTISKNFGKEIYKNIQIKNRGIFQKYIDQLKVLHGGWGLITDMFDDVRMAVPAYKKSLKELQDLIRDSSNESKKAQDDALRQEAAKAQTNSPSTNPEEGSIDDVEQSISNFNAALQQKPV